MRALHGLGLLVSPLWLRKSLAAKADSGKITYPNPKSFPEKMQYWEARTLSRTKSLVEKGSQKDSSCAGPDGCETASKHQTKSISETKQIWSEGNCRSGKPGARTL